MAETIKIAELAIDNKKLLTTLQQTKKGIDDLAVAQFKLKAAGETNSQQFIQNEADLKSLKQEYNQQQKVLQATTKANSNLTAELDKEIKSLDAAKQNNAELKIIRNQLNAETVEGAKAIDAINKKVDENTDFIKANISQLEVQKTQIGDYKNGIKDAFQEMNIFNGGLAGFAARSKEAGGASNLIGNSLKGMAQGFVGLTKASLAFIATPVGAVLAAIVAVFALVRNAMNRSEESTNKIKEAFSAFGGIVKGLMKVLEPVGKFLIDGIVKAFALVEKGIFKALNAIATGLEFLGLDTAAKKLKTFTNEIEASAKASKELARAEAELTKAQRTQEKVQLDAQKAAEKLRQIRDDETLSTAERVKANEDLGKSLQNQLASELLIANKALEVAQLRLQADGESKEALDAQAEALTKIAEVQERLVSQESEQLVNRNSLLREGADKAKEAASAKAEQAALEIQLYEEQNRLLAKTDEDRLALQRVLADKEIDLLQEKLDKKLITETEFQLEKLALENALIESEEANQEAELQRLSDFENRKLELQNEIDLAKEESELAKAELKLEQDYEKQLAELELLELNETEKTELLALLEEQRALALADITDKFQKDELAKTKAANLALIEAESQRTEAMTNLAKQLSDKLAGLLGETLAGRIGALLSEAAFAILQIKNNAAKANAIATANDAAIPAVLPPGIPNPAKAVSIASTIKAKAANSLAAGRAIAQVVASQAIKAVKFKSGGILNGASHLNGGIPTPYGELEGGEAVINTRSTAMYKPLLSAINESGGGKRFAQGGILGASSAPSNLINYEKLGQEVAKANLSLPAPQVSVQEIGDVSSRLTSVEEQVTL